MNTTCQSYYTLKNPGDNIDKTHELYTLYYLSLITTASNTYKCPYFREDITDA